MAVVMTVLASGSKGNCTLISTGRTRLLVDAGLSCRELLRRIALCGETSSDIDAILITHEHSDHVGGLNVLAKKLKVPVYMTGATHEVYRQLCPRQLRQPHHAGTAGDVSGGTLVRHRRRDSDAVYHSA